MGIFLLWATWAHEYMAIFVKIYGLLLGLLAINLKARQSHRETTSMTSAFCFYLSHWQAYVEIRTSNPRRGGRRSQEV